MDEITKIKLLIERSISLFEEGEEQVHKLSSDELIRLIELVEEEQANYILDRIQDNHKEPTKWVSQQLTENE